jgi:hypothetical protein
MYLSTPHLLTQIGKLQEEIFTISAQILIRFVLRQKDI